MLPPVPPPVPPAGRPPRRGRRRRDRVPGDSADAAQIAAVSPTPGKIDVFTRDPSTGQLRQTSYDQATGLWTAWALRGGTLKAGTEIAAVSRSSTSIDVFFRNPSDLVQRTTASGTAWSTPVTVSSNTANGGPSAVVTGTHRADRRAQRQRRHLPAAHVDALDQRRQHRVVEPRHDHHRRPRHLGDDEHLRAGRNHWHQRHPAVLQCDQRWRSRHLGPLRLAGSPFPAPRAAPPP